MVFHCLKNIVSYDTIYCILNDTVGGDMRFSKTIKFIRETLGLNQGEFASKIGVERLAIIRWENDKVVPSKIVQTRLYEIVKKNNISVYNSLIENIPKYKLENNILTLYHSSKAGIQGSIKPISRNHCDFGSGFYMGNQVQQPLTLVCTNPKSMLYVVELDLTDLKIVEVEPSIDWALLIGYYRGKLEGIKETKLYEKYKKMLFNCDVVVGSIADDRIFYVLDRFFEGTITDKGLIESLSALQLGVQYVAITQKACKQIKIVYKEELSEFMKLYLEDISEQNRQYGITTANEICRTYRREGRYFDEILKEGK